MKTLTYLFAAMLGVILSVPLTIYLIAIEQAVENKEAIKAHLDNIKKP